LLRGSKRLLSAPFSKTTNNISVMPREHIILECTEARAEGKPVSRYMSSRDKKQQPDRVEKKKYNKFLRRHTLHREIKG
jgi:large subunit ribosomal protein L33